MSATATHRAIDAVWRIESARIIAVLTRMVRDVGLAEDIAHDALLAALERWPKAGIPDNPGAWLMATAKHRAIDLVRRDALIDRKHNELAIGLDTAHVAPDEGSLDDGVGDDMLGLMFMSAHPILSREARTALTLKLLGGLTTEEIARACLTPETSIAQRIVRAKRTLRDARVSFETPDADERARRLASVLEVIYLIFNEGYSATSGEELTRPTLCEEAMRLGRVLAALTPAEAEVHGLVALMELQASRLRARVDRDGTPVLLLDQNRARWDQLLIRRGLSALSRAESLGSMRGAYTLQAAIAACHARATVAADTNWVRIAELYDELLDVAASPVVELNRAVAVSMAFGPAAGLEILDALVADPALANYHLLAAARGDILERLQRTSEARTEFLRAASRALNQRERAVLLERAAALERMQLS